MGSRPFIRSSLARSMYERMLKDEHLRSLNKSQWYRCDLNSVPDGLRDLFIQSSLDHETDVFLETCFEKSDWMFTQFFHALAKVVLCWFMTRTSINGFLGRGSMFVFSVIQFERLLGIESIDGWRGEALLDLGAGDGKVTDNMAKYFNNVYATEISPVMSKILSKKGYRVLDVETWSEEPIEYDVISCLNLLDRCDKPLTLLQEIRRKLKPKTGRLLVAVVLPLSQYVESGGRNHAASEKMMVRGRTFEEQLSSFVSNVLVECGFEVLRWTRLPYLCEGDINQAFYWLDDAVLVLKAKDDDPETDCISE